MLSKDIEANKIGKSSALKELTLRGGGGRDGEGFEEVTRQAKGEGNKEKDQIVMSAFSVK